jgi:cobalt-zinc-cadmium efflux system membrane fusion protein
MNTERNILRTVLLGGALLVAGGVGFLIARSTTQTPPPPAPVAAAPVAEADELKLDPSYLDVVGIKTEAVSAGNLSFDVLAPATVTAAPNGEAVVTAHVAGTVIRLARQLGDAVRTGETLALVESREAAAMAAEQSVAASKADLARSQLAREQELYNQRVTPRQDLERAQAELAVAEAEVRRAREAAAASHVTQDGRIAVVSPLAGRITQMRGSARQLRAAGHRTLPHRRSALCADRSVRDGDGCRPHRNRRLGQDIDAPRERSLRPRFARSRRP